MTAKETELERNGGCTKQHDSSNDGDEVEDGRMDANEHQQARTRDRRIDYAAPRNEKSVVDSVHRTPGANAYCKPVKDNDRALFVNKS